MELRCALLMGPGEAAARQSFAQRERVTAEVEPLRVALAPMGAGMRYTAMVQALGGVGKVSSTGQPLAPARVAGSRSGWFWRASPWVGS